MKIKDILEDYSIHPNIPVKHLANDNDDTNWMNVDLKAQGMFG
jgi:hypothetical protein